LRAASNAMPRSLGRREIASSGLGTHQPDVGYA
jgi:hypothetical protein